jgi:Fe-Mn family superoxide dismutase
MYTPKSFTALLGTPGMSDALLTNHFTLYEGYVKNTNTLLDTLRKGIHKPGTPEWNELTRRFGWEWNGMRLHELYFGNMIKGGQQLSPDSALAQKIVATWGSIDAWQSDFVGVGTMRGIGWVVLSYDPQTEALFNVWVNEHDAGHLAGTTPLLVMDVFEHAFMLDYGIKRADYIQAFIAAIDWSVATARIA